MTEYKFFSYPNCEKCVEAKDFLKSVHVAYSEFNIGMPSGKKEWGKILMDGYKPKTKENGDYIMPIFVKSNGTGIEAIVQGPEDIKTLFS